MNTKKNLIKSLFCACLFLFLSCSLIEAQWSRTAPNIYPTTLTDNVGIGTTTPSSQLHIKKTTDNAFLTVETSINYKFAGIKLIGYHNGTTATSQIYMDYYGTNNQHGLHYISGRANYANHWFQDAGGTVQMCILSNGNVGIGCPTPTVKLAVNGKIQATEIEIKPAPCADFVFNDNYNLKSLEEVESFINTNKHLPDVPSASEVKENGINIGNMNAILLQKVEELTLYIIEQNKKIHELENTINNR